MRQQINLYQPIFSEERKLLSAASVALAFVAMLVTFIAFSVHANLRVQKLALQAEVLRTQQAQQEHLLESDEPESAAAIQTRVDHLERLVAERARALEILRSGAAGQTLGFAPRLEALSRRHLDGITIETIQLSGVNGAMSLSGATRDPDLVPAYLRSLAQDSVLAGTRFDDFLIERPQAEPDENKDGAESPRNLKQLDPKLVRFRAGSSALPVADSEEKS